MSENGRATPSGDFCIGEREIDRLCWIILSTRNRFHPIKETAEECIDHMEESDSDVIEVTERSRGHEIGYHAGMFVAYDEIVNQLSMYGIDVVSRANRYLDMNRAEGIELRTEDQPDYFEPVQSGSEHPDNLWESVEIEELGEASYEVES